MAKVSQQEMIEAVKAHAIQHYEKGWHYIVECWGEEEIAEEIVGCRSIGGAIRKVGQFAKLMHEREREWEGMREW